MPFLVPEMALKESLQALDWLDLKGFSVTIPHKEQIIPLLSTTDGAAARTGACNTVVIKDGAKIGYNTDYRAAIDSLEDALGGRGADGSSPLAEKHVLILGAGGVARAIAFGCVRRGANVTITNRTDERATSLAAQVGCRLVNWGQRVATLAEVIVNCTPVGMHPNVDDSPVPPAAFNKPNMVAFDTVYRPENTMFLKLARERDCKTVSGVDMFVGAGVGAVQALHGDGRAGRPDARGRRPQARADPRMTPAAFPSTLGLALVGYRGTGKSTVGRILAERLGARSSTPTPSSKPGRAGRSPRSSRNSVSRPSATWRKPSSPP